MAEVDRTRFSYRHHSFIIFVDGVEIPWLFLQFRCQLGSPTTVEIHIEPDDLIERIRPKTYVHIFMSDPYTEDEPAVGRPVQEFERDQRFDKKRYYLCFEGQIQGVTESESAESRSMVLSCSDLFSVINNTSLDLVQLDNGINIPMVNGSTFYGSYVDGDTTNPSILKYVIYAAMGFATTSQDTAQSTRETQLRSLQDQQYPLLRDGRQGSSRYFYFDAVRLALKYFLQFNASYRLQAMRSRLFDKMFGVSDQTFQRFMERRVAQTLITQGFENVPYTTLGQLMMYMLSLGLHNYTSMLFPVPNDEATEGAWNQYLFLPNLYYALPPTCNWIFPEHIQSLNASRFFMQEPTRIGVNDPMVGGVGLMHLAPPNLTDMLTGGNPPVKPDSGGAFSTAALFGAPPTVSATPRDERELDSLPFRLTAGAENPVSNPNLLRLLSASEVEKGIIFRHSDISVEYFAGVHGVTDTSLYNTDFRQPEIELPKLNNAVREQVRTDSPYIKFNRIITNYRLTLERLNRDVTLAGPFNPWAVAGFPAVVCRQDRSYRGLLVGLTHTIGASGEAQTVYNLAYTTLFRPKLGGFTIGVREVKEKTIDARRALATLQATTEEILAEDSRLKSDNASDLRTELTGYADDLPKIEEALSQFALDTADWEKTQNLDPLLSAVKKLDRDLPDRAKSAIGSLLSETTDALTGLNSSVKLAQRAMQFRVIGLQPTEAAEAQQWMDDHGVTRGTARPRSVTFYIRLDDLLGVIDHLYDYPFRNVNPAEPFLFPTTADIRTSPNFASPATGEVRELRASDYIRESTRKEFTVRFPRVNQEVLTAEVKDLFVYSTNKEASFKYVAENFETGLFTVGGSTKGFVLTPGALTAFNPFASDAYGYVTVRMTKELTGVQDNEVVTENPVLRTITKIQELIDALLERVTLTIRSVAFRDSPEQLSRLQKDLEENEKQQTQLQNLTNDLLKAGEALIESAPMMPFANPKLVDPSQVEFEYRPVLGESTILRDLSPQGLSTDFRLAEDLDGRFLQGVAGENFFRLATKIFNFDSGTNKQTLYDNWVRNGDVPKEINDFGRRKGALTLEEFLNRTELTLLEETARFGPFTRTFYRMVSSSESQGSYFDCLLGNNTKVTGTGTDADRDIEQMREEVYREADQPLLYEEARQEIMLDYARTHFVPRALRGK